MKIYNKGYFISGLLFFVMIPLLWYWDANIWLYMAAFAFSVKNFYVALSKTESKMAEVRVKHYDEVGCQMYGKFYQWKVNLPWVFTIVFLGIAIFLRFVVEYWLPVEVYVIFMILLLACAVYSFRIQRDITEYIDANYGIEDDTVETE